MEMTQPVPSERILERVEELIAAVLVAQIMEKIGVAVRPVFFGADPRTNCGADFSGASDHGENR